MTLFEYLAIAFSIVFSMSAMRLASGLPHAAQAKRRDFVHLSHTVGLLVATAGVFWLFWGYRDVSWTFPRFVLALANPAILYVAASTLIPDNPEAIESWRDHFSNVRVRYFLLILCWTIVTATLTTVVLELPLLHPARGIQGLLLVVAMVGLVSSRPRTHGAIALALLAIVLAAFFLVLVPLNLER